MSPTWSYCLCGHRREGENAVLGIFKRVVNPCGTPIIQIVEKQGGGIKDPEKFFLCKDKFSGFCLRSAGPSGTTKKPASRNERRLMAFEGNPCPYLPHPLSLAWLKAQPLGSGGRSSAGRGSIGFDFWDLII